MSGHPSAMARNEIFIHAPAQVVFDALATPRSYRYWVPGTQDVREADPDFPAVGTSFGYTVGWPPLGISGRRTVAAAKRPERLELDIQAPPFGRFRSELRVTPERDGTRVVMIEEPASRLVRLLMGPLGHAAVRLRNVESLRRLRRYAEHRSARQRAGAGAGGRRGAP